MKRWFDVKHEKRLALEMSPGHEDHPVDLVNLIVRNVLGSLLVYFAIRNCNHLSNISFFPLIRLIALKKLDVHETTGCRGFRSNILAT